MLVLSRKPGESLRIGSNVRITVVSANSRQVRIAIEAPDDVPVHREEVYDRIAAANREAVAASPELVSSLAQARGRGRGGEGAE